MRIIGAILGCLVAGWALLLIFFPVFPVAVIYLAGEIARTLKLPPAAGVIYLIVLIVALVASFSVLFIPRAGAASMLLAALLALPLTFSNDSGGFFVPFVLGLSLGGVCVILGPRARQLGFMRTLGALLGCLAAGWALLLIFPTLPGGLLFASGAVEDVLPLPEVATHFYGLVLILTLIACFSVLFAPRAGAASMLLAALLAAPLAFAREVVGLLPPITPFILALSLGGAFVILGLRTRRFEVGPSDAPRAPKSGQPLQRDR